jgi:hypothetical protein
MDVRVTLDAAMAMAVEAAVVLINDANYRLPPK